MIKTVFKGIGNTWVKLRDRIIEFSHDDAGYIKFGSIRAYFLTTAITANVTTTTSPAGSIAFTSNSTGRGLIFRSDGTKWQVSTAAVPVKATGAELDTGTDDDKFATAKALADSGLSKKATGAEVNTGSDDSKFATPKALKDADAAKDAATPADTDIFYFRTAAGVPKKVTYADLVIAITASQNP